MPLDRQLVLAALLCGLLSNPLDAAEGAVSVYAPGFFSSMAGMMPGPGTYADLQFYSYDGNVEDAFLENRVVFDVDSEMMVPMVSITHVTEHSLFGGDYGFSVVGNYPFVDVTASLSAGANQLSMSESSNGIGDLAVSPLILGWHSGNWNSMFLFTIYAATGRWDIDALATTGLNRWAIEPMYNVTWFNETTGREFSFAAGYTINFRNKDTEYESGDEFHLDYTLGQWFPNGWMVGLAGYWFQQVTADQGAPAILGDNKGRVFGAGPIVNFTRVIGERRELLFSARYYHEFGGENRPEGNAFWLRASFNF